ncbi:methyltransferase domain family protein [Apiospora phragmitis]|uniref:Methyltransferase domain family protein n=1 Tax=Apiospora phragmitis TaxID=2905665 RepID=A0ABR1UGN9_9PEZI
MVYNWDEYHDVCYRLYIEEKKPLEEIMQIMRKRAYQIQFRRWDFPSKQNPAHKNDRLVARVQELWAKNLSQKDMLRVLTEEDGFDIKHRELMRVRSRNRWLLRKSNPLLSGDHLAAAGGGHGDGAIKAQSQSSVPNLTLTLSDTEGVDDEPISDSGMYEDHVQSQTTASSPTKSPSLEATVSGRLNSRKRRRRTRGGGDGSLSTDTPGPSRFPSETTIDESRSILNLDASLYRELRLRFARICEVTGVSKKTAAGPTRWEEVKSILIGDIAHLQTVMWVSQDNLDGKRLALDVICTDVTKRMRTAEQKMTIAEAKNILEIDPEESRTIRQEYVAILKEDNFSSKTEGGKEHWEELKRRWMANSAVLCRILAPDTRLRDDQSRRGPKKAASKVVASPSDSHRTPHVAEERIRITAATPLEMSPSEEGCLVEVDYTPIQQVHLESTPTPLASDPTTPETMHIDPDTSPIQTSGHLRSRDHRMANAPQSMRNGAATHQQPLATSPMPDHNHMMPGTVLDHSLPIDPHINTTALPVLLTSPDISAHAAHHHAAQTPSFMTPQHLPQVQAQSQSLGTPSSQHNSNAFVPSPFPTPPSPAPPVAVYLRLHPSSPVHMGPPIWISTLTTRTFAELQQTAVKGFNDAGATTAVVCERVEGILGEGMTIEISRDDELRAYLAVVEGRGGRGRRGRRGSLCSWLIQGGGRVETLKALCSS